jgi:hypothetical protein
LCAFSTAVADQASDELPPPEEIERRLQELSDLYGLSMALREARFVELPRKPEADRAREKPDEPA